MEPKYLLIVKQPRGLVIRDTPRPESQGGRTMRNVTVGTQLYAYGIHNIEGVPYARLVPQNPQKPEWVRVEEADSSIEYVDVIEMEHESDSLTNAINMHSGSITLLAAAIRDLAKK